jgi:hypothetical protein
LFLASEALCGRNAPERIRLLEKAEAIAPEFLRPARDLAGFYFTGKRVDVTRARQNLAAFFAGCPVITDGYPNQA